MYKRHEDYEKDLKKALNARTTEDELIKIIGKHYGEITIAEAVAQNPSCPQGTFIILYRYKVETAEKNPSLHKYMEDPHWTRKTSRTPSMSYSRWDDWDVQDKMPAYRVAYRMTYGTGELQRKTIALENIPPDTINQYVKSKSAPLRKVIASRETVPIGVFELLAKDSARTVRLALAKNPVIPGDIVTLLCSDSDSEIKKIALDHPNCPEDVAFEQKRMSLSEPKQAFVVGEDLWQNAELAFDCDDPELLDQLSKCDSPCIRFIVGINPATPVHILERLAVDHEQWVRAGPAYNPNTSSEILESLLSSKNTDVQVGLASNPSLSLEQQGVLASVCSDSVGLVLANNTSYMDIWRALASKKDVKQIKKSKSWRDILALLLHDSEKGKITGMVTLSDKNRHLFAARIAARSSACPEKASPYYAYYLSEDYNKNPNVSLALLEGRTSIKGYAFQDWKVDKWLQECTAPGLVCNYFARGLDTDKRRIQSISNPTTLLKYLFKVVVDKDTLARKRLAQRSDINRFVFEMLARDLKSSVREAIASHKRCPKALLGMMQQDKEATVSIRSKKRVSQNKSVNPNDLVNKGSATERKKLVVGCENSEILDALANDRAASVRLAVVSNRHTELRTLLRLVDDPVVDIRSMVAYYLKCRKSALKMIRDVDEEVCLHACKNRLFSTYNKEYDKLEFDREMLEIAVNSNFVKVKAYAASRVTNPGAHYLKFKHEPEVLIELAKNRYADTALLGEIVENTSDQDLLAVVVKSTTDESLYVKAANKITSTHVEESICRNRKMLERESVLMALENHSIPRVRQVVEMKRSSF